MTSPLSVVGFSAAAAAAAAVVYHFGRRSMQERLLAHDQLIRGREVAQRTKRKRLRLILVRHGESAANVLGSEYIGGRDESSPLSPTGEQQVPFTRGRTRTSHSSKSGLHPPVPSDPIRFDPGAACTT